MKYDAIGTKPEIVNGYTFKDIIDALEKHNEKIVTFIDTDFTMSEVISWRGSYDLPAIKYDQSVKAGQECIDLIKKGLSEIHEGWKGGEYEYDESATPYLVSEGRSCEEYQIVGYEISENKLIFITKIIPY